MNRWSRNWGLIWVAWCVMAVVFAIWPNPWRAILVGFWFIGQEGMAIISRDDPDPALTEELHRYIPGWITFPVLALGIYRLNYLGVPTWVCVMAWGWLCWHFTQTYESSRWWK